MSDGMNIMKNINLFYLNTRWYAAQEWILHTLIWSMFNMLMYTESKLFLIIINAFFLNFIKNQLHGWIFGEAGREDKTKLKLMISTCTYY